MAIRRSQPILLLSTISLAAACVEDDADDTSSAITPPSSDYGTTVRLFDLVVEDGADLRLLGTWEVMVVEGPRPSIDGETFVTIRSTRALADRLAPLGFRVLDDDPFRAGQLTADTSPKFFPCGVEPTDSELFPPYDAHPSAFNDGLAQEMLAMDGSGAHVESIATTEEGRDLLAVRVGPVEGEIDENTPTVYVLAAYHAREWVTTAVTMKTLRATIDAATTGSDEVLQEALFGASVVFVPVVNPDGYEHSRFTYRDQRKNRRAVGCSTNAEGVDLNRNHTFTWDLPVDSGSNSPCNDLYIGDSPASEPETQGVEAMLRNEIFAGKAAAVFSYHSYADIGIYPMGLKLDTDGDGPRCWPDDNCMNPDLMTYRRLWGDTENPKSFSATGLPYPMDMINNVIYTTSGDVMAQGAYTDPRVMGISHELTSTDVGFYIECDSNREAIIDDLVAQNLAILTDVLEAAPGLVDTSASTAYATNEMGTWAPGMWVREASDGFDHDTARPRFVKPVWRSAAVSPPVQSQIDGNVYTLNPARSATQYESFMLDLSETPDPWCIPCEVMTWADGWETGDGSGCSGCIDLTDPDRLIRDGWELIDAGDDYWWQPVDVPSGGATLEIGGGTPPGGASHCNLMFSTRWNPGGGGDVVLERDSGGGYEPVTYWPMPAPFNDLRNSDRLRTYMVEANGLLPSGIPQFRFLVPDGSPLPDIRVYEPVIYCRIGGLP
jgi:hypothetical protein